jgi:hypothetical protein
MAGGREFRLRTIFEGIGQQLVFAPVGSQDGFEQLADDPEVEITFELVPRRLRAPARRRLMRVRAMVDRDRAPHSPRRVRQV